jgi:hypothetical protein
MYLPFHMAKEIIEGIINATKEAYWNICGQLIIHFIAKNLVFHNRSKYIDTRFHYLRDCITNKEVEVKYVKTQDQVTDIFTKPLKYNVFIKMRDMLGVMKKSSLREEVQSKPYFVFWKIQKRLTGLVDRIQFLFILGFSCISLIHWLSMILCL